MAETAKKKLPDAAQEMKPTPDPAMESREIQAASADAQKEMPQTGVPENMVVIGGEMVEIKPTKLKYQRNRTALFYKMLDIYPLADIMGMDAGAFGDQRDGDKAVMDFLIAATDNERLILDNYDEMDTGTIERILAIFKRVNKIQEKEAKLKNLEASRKKVG